ncbi:MAG: MurR/RpiR family transcriptional regulator [Hyphomicrobiaceae bacterium]|nr:MurR/RpiR family transcriptional regulator [Hyphomicrobiaceae bacterium]
MSRFDGLSPQLRRAAEFVVEHPDEVATRTLRQVAKAADITPPTLSRLARALDCETYEDLREICRGELKRRNRILADKAEALLQISTESSPGAKSGVFVSQAGAAIENIQDLIEGIDLEKLRATAITLANARKVVLFGTSSGLAVAQYFACMARLGFDNWRVAGADGTLWSTSFSDVGPGDAVFLASIRPYGNLPVRAAKAARDAGADVIVITDDLASPYVSIASQCFIVGTESPQFFPSHVAALVLIEGLMGMVVRRGGKEVIRRIKASESLAHSIGEYWVN